MSVQYGYKDEQGEVEWPDSDGDLTDYRRDENGEKVYGYLVGDDSERDPESIDVTKLLASAKQVDCVLVKRDVTEPVEVTE